MYSQCEHVNFTQRLQLVKIALTIASKGIKTFANKIMVSVDRFELSKSKNLIRVLYRYTLLPRIIDCRRGVRKKSCPEFDSLTRQRYTAQCQLPHNVGSRTALSILAVKFKPVCLRLYTSYTMNESWLYSYNESITYAWSSDAWRSANIT